MFLLTVVNFFLCTSECIMIMPKGDPAGVKTKWDGDIHTHGPN